MKRIKSIDSFRGLIMFLMLWVHLVGWWSSASAEWLDIGTYVFIDRTLAPAFLFLSGMSAMLYYKTGMLKIQNVEKSAILPMRNEYLIRAFFIFLLGFIYNIFVAIFTLNLLNAWKWFLLMTIGISLMLLWPFFKISKYLKIFLAASFWILNSFILSYLLAFKGQANIQGVLYYIFYNTLDLEPILSSFSFTLLGSAFGHIIFDIYNKYEEVVHKKKVAFQLIIPSFIIGLSLIILALILGYPQTLLDVIFANGPIPNSLRMISQYLITWVFMSVGFIIVILSIFMIIDDYIILKTKKDTRFLYYFSYYSLTFYLFHNILFFLFLSQLDVIPMFIAFSISAFLIFLLLKGIYNSSWKAKFSLKFQIGRMAKSIAQEIEKKRNK